VARSRKGPQQPLTPLAPRHDGGADQNDGERQQFAMNDRGDQPQLPGADIRNLPVPQR